MKILNWIKSHRVEVIFIVLILLIGGFLRFYEIGDFTHFGSDEARDSFLIRSIARDGDIQLLGPSIAPGQHPTYLGPFFYYFLVPSYWLSGSSPTAGAITVAIFSFISIGLLYFIARRWYGVMAAITSSFLYSVSWIIVYYGRWAWNPNLVPFFMLSLIVCLYFIVQADVKYKPWWLYTLAIIVGGITQLHGTALFVLPPFLIIYFLIFRPKIKWYKYYIALLILLILYSPLIYFDINNNLSNTQGFVSLFIDRDSNGGSFLDKFNDTYNNFYKFYHESLSHEEVTWFFVIIFEISLVYLFFKTYQYIKKRQKKSKNILMLLWLLLPFVVFIFYDDFMPPHYFSLVFPLPFLLVGSLMQLLSKNKWLRIISISIPLIFGAILIFNSYRLFVDLKLEGSRSNSYQITYMELEQVKNYIIEDSGGNNYSLQVVPWGSYERSFEYIFDQDEYSLNEGENYNQYIIILGNSIYTPDSSESVYVNNKRIGNILVIKKHPSVLDVQ